MFNPFKWIYQLLHPVPKTAEELAAEREAQRIAAEIRAQRFRGRRG